jgi:hypothetical protein
MLVRSAVSKGESDERDAAAEIENIHPFCKKYTSSLWLTPFGRF